MTGDVDPSSEFLLRIPALPDFDPSDVVDSAVVRGWYAAGRVGPRCGAASRTSTRCSSRARADFPESMLPFGEDPRYRELDEGTRKRIRAWAWIAYNKTVVDIEQFVVNPGFGLLFRDGLGIGLGDTHRIGDGAGDGRRGVTTRPTHLNASVLTRTHRGRQIARNSALPYGRDGA